MRLGLITLAIAVTMVTPARAERWVAAWGAAPVATTSSGPTNATTRDLVRVSAAGSAIRIRVSNALGDTPLVIGRAAVALAQRPGSAALVPGTGHAITFGGKPGITLAPKTAYVYSDPVDLPVARGQDLAIDLSLPTAEPASLTATWNTSFVTADGAGDRVGQADGFTAGPSSTAFTAHPAGTQVPLSCDGCSTYALTAVDVRTSQTAGAIVGLGSSTFHGDGSDQDGWDSVLNDLPGTLVNAGIAGDTLHAGLERVERDAFSQSGVAGILVYDLNDIAPPTSRTAEQVETDYRTLVEESHARGLKVYCPTWPPDASLNTPTDERSKINAWLLASHTCDGVVDWGAVLRDPQAPNAFRPEYFSDGMHPNPAGHRAIADATPRQWFAVAPPGCHGRPRLVVRLRARHLRVARIYVNGTRVAIRHRRSRVVLRHLPSGRSRLRVVIRTRHRTIVRTRSVSTCA